MNNHLERLKEQEKATKRQRKNNSRMVRLFAALVILCIALSSMIGVMMSIGPKKEKTSNEENAKETVEISDEDKWKLIIVNKDRIVPKDFTVDLIKFENTRVDYRISDPLKAMTDDAKKDNIVLTVLSGFRSVSEQKELYNSKIKSFESQGYSTEASKIYANQYIQPPGASEHHTGLAIDLGTEGVLPLDEKFSETSAYKWLKENAAQYGFIERYPNDKTDITGVSWEPWHFRYVGEENAKAITSMGICLEEYG